MNALFLEKKIHLTSNVLMKENQKKTTVSDKIVLEIQKKYVWQHVKQHIEVRSPMMIF